MTIRYNDFFMDNELEYRTDPTIWSGPDFNREREQFVSYFFDTVEEMSTATTKSKILSPVSDNLLHTLESPLLQDDLEPEKLSVPSKETTPSSSGSFAKPTMHQLEREMIDACGLRLYRGQIVRFDGKIYSYINEKDFITLARMNIPQTVKKVTNVGQFSNVVNFMKTNPSIELAWDEDTQQKTVPLIPFENFVFDISTGELHNFNRSLPLFYHLNCNYVEDDYMPVWNDFLDRTFQDDDASKNLIYEMIGYLVMNGRPAKKFFLCFGQPNSGKSALAEWISSVIGKKLVAGIALGDLSERFSLAKLSQLRLNCCMDLPDSRISTKAASIIKILTGDAAIDTEKKGVDRETTYHDCKFLFGSNHPIRLQSDDPAFWNRLSVLPFRFEVAPQDRDPNLVEKLKLEADQIVSEAARRCITLHQRNYEFICSTYAEEMIRNWRGQSEEGQVQRFIEDACDITGDKNDFLTTENLYQSYIEYCNKAGESPLCQKNRLSNIIREIPNTFKGKHCVDGLPNAVHGTHGIKFK